MMISYAQNGEDVILSRVFPGDRGFFIDLGANDPVADSVTKLFYDRGWRGINVEPEPAAFRRVAEGRPDDLNLNLGVSDRDGALTFFDAPAFNGWSTFSGAQAANLRAQGVELVERQVPVTTLARICEDHVDGPIDFLKVDVESHETQVMAGADWSRWRPRVVLVEANGWVHWEPGLIASGYLFALFDGVNRFYVREEDRELLPRFALMANFTDDFRPYAYMKAIQDVEGRLASVYSSLVETQARLAAESVRSEDASGRLAIESERLRNVLGQLATAEARLRKVPSWYWSLRRFSGRQLRTLSSLKRSGRAAG